MNDVKLIFQPLLRSLAFYLTNIPLIWFLSLIPVGGRIAFVLDTIPPTLMLVIEIFVWISRIALFSILAALTFGGEFDVWRLKLTNPSQWQQQVETGFQYMGDHLGITVGQVVVYGLFFVLVNSVLALITGRIEQQSEALSQIIDFTIRNLLFIALSMIYMLIVVRWASDRAGEISYDAV